MDCPNILKALALGASLLIAGQASAELVLSTQPRGPHTEVDRPFEELASYLTKLTGAAVSYRYMDDWLTYATEMQSGQYDIAFDGPAFVSWRMRNQNHEVLAKIAGDSVRHVVVVKKDNNRIKSIHGLAGHTVCGRPTPNLASLVLLKEFTNPMRQPIIVPAESYDDAFQKMLAGRCTGALVGESRFKKYSDEDRGMTKVVFTSEPLPTPAITAGPRVTPEQKRKIVEALTAPEASKHIGTFLKKYAGDKPFVAANPAAYRPHYILLKHERGFENHAGTGR